jgi:hypothetical protein
VGKPKPRYRPGEIDAFFQKMTMAGIVKRLNHDAKVKECAIVACPPLNRRIAKDHCISDHQQDHGHQSDAFSPGTPRIILIL